MFQLKFMFFGMSTPDIWENHNISILSTVVCNYVTSSLYPAPTQPSVLSLSHQLYCWNSSFLGAEVFRVRSFSQLLRPLVQAPLWWESPAVTVPTSPWRRSRKAGSFTAKLLEGLSFFPVLLVSCWRFNGTENSDSEGNGNKMYV